MRSDSVVVVSDGEALTCDTTIDNFENGGVEAADAYWENKIWCRTNYQTI